MVEERFNQRNYNECYKIANRLLKSNKKPEITRFNIL